MDILNDNKNKNITLPLSLSFDDDKEDLIKTWINEEGLNGVNAAVDFEIATYKYEGGNINYLFKFFCCGDSAASEDTNPFYPYNKQSMFTKSGGYFINSFANTLRNNNNLHPATKQIIGVDNGNNDWIISVSGQSKSIREVSVDPMSNDVIKNSQFIFNYYNTNTISNRKKITNLYVSANSTMSGPDQFNFSKLIFLGLTGQTKFNLTGYNVIDYTTVQTIFPTLNKFVEVPKDITYPTTKIPILSLDKYNKTMGNNIYLPKSSDVTEMYAQIFFFNAKTNGVVQMASRSGSTESDILDTNGDGTLFYRRQYNEKYGYIKLLLSADTKTYGIRMFRPTDDAGGGVYDVNPYDSVNGTTINLYEKIIVD